MFIQSSPTRVTFALPAASGNPALSLAAPNQPGGDVAQFTRPPVQFGLRRRTVGVGLALASLVAAGLAFRQPSPPARDNAQPAATLPKANEWGILQPLADIYAEGEWILKNYLMKDMPR